MFSKRRVKKILLIFFAPSIACRYSLGQLSTSTHKFCFGTKVILNYHLVIILYGTISLFSDLLASWVKLSADDKWNYFSYYS